uniref:Protein kinase domain-containing protein n=1 Tax=Heterorhabditis bacteriophora TaxID=37862 RepID=A0A1I7WN61_HETBA
MEPAGCRYFHTIKADKYEVQEHHCSVAHLINVTTVYSTNAYNKTLQDGLNEVEDIRSQLEKLQTLVQREMTDSHETTDDRQELSRLRWATLGLALSPHTDLPSQYGHRIDFDRHYRSQMTMAVVILGLLTASLRSSLTAPSSTIEGILTSIVRKPGLPDAIFPTVCPPACEDLFHAEEGSLNATLSDKCSCVCPRGAPIYLNTAGYCVEKLDECRHNIAFNSSIESERHLPVVSLPARNGVVHPKVPILWRGANPYHLPSGRTRAEIFFILILLVLLALSLIGSFVVWHMCWRIKKRQLISDIQMQFLYHFKQQQEAHKSLHSTILDVTPDEAENSVMSQESPRSEAKSIDSGRESKEDSDDSSRDGEEDESAEEQNNVRNIVNGFESRLAHPSQLPVSSSCSPRFIPPTNVIRPASSQIPILLGQSSPRPVQRTLALPRASSVSNSPTLMEYSDKRSRKSYTIFPADPMLNKSLTRRPKRAIPRPVVHAE